MWTLYRAHRGVPISIAVEEGRTIGMQRDREKAVLNRLERLQGTKVALCFCMRARVNFAKRAAHLNHIQRVRSSRVCCLKFEFPEGRVTTPCGRHTVGRPPSRFDRASARRAVFTTTLISQISRRHEAPL